jgi:hypothetical protein
MATDPLPGWKDRPARGAIVKFVERTCGTGYAYTGGADTALRQAEAEDWTVVSIQNDWTTVFPT